MTDPGSHPEGEPVFDDVMDSPSWQLAAAGHRGSLVDDDPDSGDPADADIPNDRP